MAVLFKQYEKYPELQTMSLDDIYLYQQSWPKEWAEHLSMYFVSKGKDPLPDSDLIWPVV